MSRTRTKQKVRDILARHHPVFIDAATDASLRSRRPLRLAPVWLDRAG